MPLSDGIEFFAATDVGRKRRHNEDNFLVDRDLGLFVVADGMGGHAAGEVASALAVRVVHEVLTAQREVLDQRRNAATLTDLNMQSVLGILEFAVNTASSRIFSEGQRDPQLRGMGTTISILLTLGAYGFIAHVGDTRVYLYRGGRVSQLTEDHTIANELLKLGALTAEQVALVPRNNAITRGVGVYQHVNVDTHTIELLPRDRFLVCSDGLTRYLDEKAGVLPNALETHAPEACVRELVDFANAEGGKDNITAVVVELGGGDQGDSQRARQLAMKRAVLAGLPLFLGLNERDLERVLTVAQVIEVAAGAMVVTEGEVGDAMYVILDGRLEVTKGRTVLGELRVGEHVGEMALVRSTARSASVRAVTPAELVVLRRSEFFEIIRTEPTLATKLLWQFVDALADRLEQTSAALDAVRAKQKLSDEVMPLSSSRRNENPFDASPKSVGARAARVGIGLELPSGLEAEIRDDLSVDDSSYRAGHSQAAAAASGVVPPIPIGADGATTLDTTSGVEAEPDTRRRFEQRLELKRDQLAVGTDELSAKTTRPGTPAGKQRAEGAQGEPSTTPQRSRTSTLRSVDPNTAAPTSQPAAMPIPSVPSLNEGASAARRPAPDLRATVQSAGHEAFRPTKATLPMRPDEALAEELEKLRHEYREKQAAQSGDPAARTSKTKPDGESGQ